MKKQEKNNNIAVVGLRELSEDDIEEISEAALALTRRFLEKRVKQRDISDFEITVDIDFTTELRIEIDIRLNLPPRIVLDENKIIKETLEETFSELDKLLQEKFTC